MSALIIVAVIVAVPLMLSVLFRVSAVYLFVSVMIGNLLVQQFSDDASLVIASFARNIDVTMVARIGLQFLPVVLVLLFARHTIGKNMMLLHVVPALFVSVLLGMFCLNLLPSTVTSQFNATDIGKQLSQSESLIIGAAAVSQLLLVWSSKPSGQHKTSSRRQH